MTTAPVLGIVVKAKALQEKGPATVAGFQEIDDRTLAGVRGSREHLSWSQFVVKGIAPGEGTVALQNGEGQFGCGSLCFGGLERAAAGQTADELLSLLLLRSGLLLKVTPALAIGGVE
jgi:hypothetical protein